MDSEIKELERNTKTKEKRNVYNMTCDKVDAIVKDARLMNGNT